MALTKKKTKSPQGKKLLKQPILLTQAQVPFRFSFILVWGGLVFLALLLALIIRLPFFGQLPNGLNRDEAALGYNAFSILKTGADEYGKRWPVSITSFGDQKLPGYVYTLVPFIAEFGLQPWVVRLPSFLAGLLVIVGLGLLALQIGEQLKFGERKKLLWSGITMLLIAICPWANHFSRTAYEAHLAMACFIFGLVAYQFALREKQTKKWQRVSFILAAVLWSATLLTYHSYQIFMPLLIGGLLVLDFARIKKADLMGIIVGCVIGLMAVGILLGGGVFRANQVKNQGITPFRKSDLAVTANTYRTVLPPQLQKFSHLVFNSGTQAVETLSQNVISVVSGTFFFVHGSGHGDHNPGNMANFNTLDALLLLIGIFQLYEFRRVPGIRRLIIWLCFGVIPASLTIQPQHEIRLSQIFPLLELVAGLGFTVFFFQFTKKWQRVVLIVIMAVLLMSTTARMFLNYTYVVPSELVSNYRYHQLAKTIIRYQAQGLPIITQSPTSSPYIWYLFESQYDPAKLNQNIERYPADGEGFIHVKRIGNVFFETTTWNELVQRASQQSMILIFQPKEVPMEMAKNSQMKLLELVNDEHGNVAYQVWLLGKH